MIAAAAFSYQREQMHRMKKIMQNKIEHSLVPSWMYHYNAIHRLVEFYIKQ